MKEMGRRIDATVSATTSWVPRLSYFRGLDGVLAASGVDLGREAAVLRADVAFESGFTHGYLVLTARHLVLLGCRGTRLRLVKMPEQSISAVTIDGEARPVIGVRFATPRGMTELRFRARPGLSVHGGEGDGSVVQLLLGGLARQVALGDVTTHTTQLFDRLCAGLQQAPEVADDGGHLGPGRGWLAEWSNPR